MRKTKEGKVIASLTEVKNKTGDIFALADEYGEVILTSYNKPRYKLIRMNISNILEEGDAPRVRKTKSQSKPKVINEDKPQEVAVNSMLDKTFDIRAWDRDNSIEKEFAVKATEPLIS